MLIGMRAVAIAANSLPEAPAGFAYLIDLNGNFLVDATGAYLLGGA